jgi:hypothetical protein
VLEQPAARHRPDGRTGAGDARPRRDGLRAFLRGKTVTRIDRVAGMISAAPAPSSARVAISWVGLSANIDASDARPKITSPTVSAPLRRSGRQRARGQQQAGEDQRVRRDDPLQLSARRAQILDQPRERDVDDRVGNHDEESDRHRTARIHSACH